MWATDEYCRIFLSCVLLRPPHPPSRIDVMADMKTKHWLIREED